MLQDSQKAAAAAAAVARSFSLSWRNQGEQGGQGVQEPMRFRSATTSGAPGVEKARNNVRQKATGETHTHTRVYILKTLVFILLQRCTFRQVFVIQLNVISCGVYRHTYPGIISVQF